jgi:hypothetical protein
MPFASSTAERKADFKDLPARSGDRSTPERFGKDSHWRLSTLARRNGCNKSFWLTLDCRLTRKFVRTE